MLKNKFLTAKELPFEQAIASGSSNLLPSTIIRVPKSSSVNFVLSSTCAMAAIEANASPRNPLVCRCCKSSAL